MQKKRKKLLRKQQFYSSFLPSNQSIVGKDSVLIDSEDEIGSFGSPGTPPPTPDTSAISSPLHETYKI